MKIFFSDPFGSKLNGLQRGAKDFFGKLDADDKNLKMLKFACFTTSTSKVKDEQKGLLTYLYCKSDPEIPFYHEFCIRHVSLTDGKCFHRMV